MNEPVGIWCAERKFNRNIGHEVDLNKLSDKDTAAVSKGGIEKSISVFHEDRIKEFAEDMNRSV